MNLQEQIEEFVDRWQPYIGWKDEFSAQDNFKSELRTLLETAFKEAREKAENDLIEIGILCSKEETGCLMCQDYYKRTSPDPETGLDK